MEELRCMRCGAPLTVDPESLIDICDYCGYPNIIVSDFGPSLIHVVPSLPRSDVENKFYEAARSDPQLSKFRDLEVIEITGAYHPAWYASLKGTVTASWQITQYEQRGKRVVARKAYLREVKNISRRVFLPARRRIPSSAVRDVLAGYIVKSSKTIPLVQEDYEWEKIKLEFLGVEVGKGEAVRIMIDKLVDALRSEYRARGEKLDFFSAKVSEVTDLKLVYVPVWSVTYVVGGASYTAVLDGYDGYCVYRSEPLTATERLARMLGGLALSMVSGSLFATTATVVGFENSLLVLGGLTLAAYSIGRSIVESARVERA
ncbi:hypothetical protein IG193_02685 [Infirmifilum lucidum]|uniref:Uncharacterized protein n=1 Tax=Infirmifilum lucidum TaxID=2776706 RepID=A0A7L9FKJ1_9CREN|nr:hypothetical protein [Infirmifilum lucidum]QOJ79386.1 hypothetical protein IG193_02685 [Infirmifilum lucidum]